MKGLENQTYLLAYIISNVAAVLILWAAWKLPRLARLLFFFLFGWASVVNWTTAHHEPQFYMEYADLTFLNLYRDFIRGWFGQHITIMVSIIAVCQALLALSMLLRDWILKTGIIGAIIFLLGIAPLGVGSAFPFSIIVSLALYFVLRGESNDYLWISTRQNVLNMKKKTVSGLDTEWSE